MTTQALRFLMEKGIDVSYMSYSGRYIGHTAAESSKNIFLRCEHIISLLMRRRESKWHGLL